MKRAALLGAVLVVALLPLSARAESNPPTFRPGAAGIGDPYFPLDGNGGYDTHDNQAATLDVEGTPREVDYAEVAKALVQVEFNRKSSHQEP